MRTIWKLQIDDRKKFELPGGAHPLCVQYQGDHLCAWFEVEKARPLVEWDLAVVGTGGRVPPGLGYIGTVQDGGFVWHLYGAEAQ